MATPWQWLGRRSLFGKYVTTFVGLVIAVLATSGGAEIWFAYRDRKAELLQAQVEKADDGAQRVEQFLAELQRQISWVTRASTVTQAQRRADYERVLRHTPAIAQLIELDSRGRKVLRVNRSGTVTGSSEDYSHAPVFQAANALSAWLGPVTFAADGPHMQIAVADSGSDPGVTIADVELKYLSDIVNGIQAGPGVYAYITTASGMLIAGTNPLRPLRGRELSHLPQIAALGHTADGTISVGRNLDGESVLAASAPIPKMKWWLLVEQPLAQALDPVYDLLGRLAVILVLALVLCIGAGILLARWMTVPIQAVRAGAARLAAGQFNQKIEIHTGDEIEALGDEFNDMAARLQDSYAKLELKVEERTRDLAQSVRELQALEEVGLALAASLDLSAVLATIVMRSVELAAADGGAIYSYDATRHAFNLAEAHGLDPAFVAAVKEVRIKRTDGLLNEVAARKVPVQIPQIANAQDFPLRGATLNAGFRSALIVPLVGPEDLLGVLVIERRREGYFPAATVGLMQTFANQSVLAMRNARLFHQVEDKGKQLAIANEHKSLFFANMSHELRTPLNAVLGFAELLQDGLYGELPERAKQVLTRIQANGTHLLGLINDVLDLSKIEAGELTLSLADYSMRNVIETVVAATDSLARTKGLYVATNIISDLPLGHGDERRLTQVLLNIVSNAIKFTDKGGMTISVEAAGSAFRLAVTDTGAGIAPEDQARIFDAFQQVDNTITKEKGGTGLGLSISKRFVEMHGGQIGVTSMPGAGSTFEIIIPIHANGQMEAA